ncbi:hypothetical protein B0H14DRAFT_3483903 [Mycena olivaceomarginata]|nr:hypothetical protein B0H14DRAFT_3483903 [Mycena olivaceomarginata]
MRLIPLPAPAAHLLAPGAPAFWITPAPANFVHCIPSIPAGFVPLWSAYPLPSMFAFAVCALDLRRLPIHCIFHGYSIPAPHAARRPPPAALIPHPMRAQCLPPTRSLPVGRCALDPAPRAACSPAT